MKEFIKVQAYKPTCARITVNDKQEDYCEVILPDEVRTFWLAISEIAAFIPSYEVKAPRCGCKLSPEDFLLNEDGSKAEGSGIEVKMRGVVWLKQCANERKLVLTQASADMLSDMLEEEFGKKPTVI